MGCSGRRLRNYDLVWRVVRLTVVASWFDPLGGFSAYTRDFLAGPARDSACDPYA
jgi:hypothetical protein